jgi:hypothetical protein
MHLKSFSTSLLKITWAGHFKSFLLDIVFNVGYLWRLQTVARDLAHLPSPTVEPYLYRWRGNSSWSWMDYVLVTTWFFLERLLR